MSLSNLARTLALNRSHALNSPPPPHPCSFRALDLERLLVSNWGEETKGDIEKMRMWEEGDEREKSQKGRYHSNFIGCPWRDKSKGEVENMRARKERRETDLFLKKKKKSWERLHCILFGPKILGSQWKQNSKTKIVV